MQWWQSGWWAVGAIVVAAVLGAAVNRIYDRWANRRADKRAARKEQKNTEFRNTVELAATDEHAYVLILGSSVSQLFVHMSSIVGATSGFMIALVWNLSAMIRGDSLVKSFSFGAGLVMLVFLVLSLARLTRTASNLHAISNRALMRKRAPKAYQTILREMRKPSDTSSEPGELPDE